MHAGAPPVLLMHGDSDALVPPDQSIRFATALADVGGTVTAKADFVLDFMASPCKGLFHIPSLSPTGRPGPGIA